MKKRRPRGASFICAFSNLMVVEVVAKIDNVKDKNYISIKECEKEKEVNKYGMGTDEHQSL